MLGEVAGLAGLQQLDLRECAVSNEQLGRMVKPLTKLKALRLSGKGAVTTVDDEGLAALAGCTDLRVLAVDELWFSDKGLKHISGCKNLSELYAAGTLLDDAAMTVLGEFKQLKKLRLAKTSVSAVGLAALGDLKLEELDLSECASSIDDASHGAAVAVHVAEAFELVARPGERRGGRKARGADTVDLVQPRQHAN